MVVVHSLSNREKTERPTDVAKESSHVTFQNSQRGTKNEGNGLPKNITVAKKYTHKARTNQSFINYTELMVYCHVNTTPCTLSEDAWVCRLYLG